MLDVNDRQFSRRVNESFFTGDSEWDAGKDEDEADDKKEPVVPIHYLLYKGRSDQQGREL